MLEETYLFEHEPLVGHTLPDTSQEEQRDPEPRLHRANPSSRFQVAVRGVCYRHILYVIYSQCVPQKTLDGERCGECEDHLERRELHVYALFEVRGHTAVIDIADR